MAPARRSGTVPGDVRRARKDLEVHRSGGSHQRTVSGRNEGLRQMSQGRFASLAECVRCCCKLFMFILNVILHNFLFAPAIRIEYLNGYIRTCF